MLSRCKPECVFINVGRGSVIQIESILEALEKKWIAGAVLDVFEEEPLKPDSPLWDMPNVFSMSSLLSRN